VRTFAEVAMTEFQKLIYHKFKESHLHLGTEASDGSVEELKALNPLILLIETMPYTTESY